MPDPSQDGGPSAPAQQAPQASGDDLSTQWSNWLDRPGNRSALMQFGIAMLQPIQQGQSFAGHIGEAIGQGGEAEARVASQARLQQEAESREALRGAQADTAEARAGAAGISANAAAERARATESLAESANRQRSLQGLLGIQRAYQAYIDQKHKSEGDPLGPTRGISSPDPSIEEWMQTQHLDPSGLHAALSGGGGEDLQVNQPQQRPAVADIAKDPTYAPRIAQAKAAIRTNPQLAQQIIRSLTPMVRDPENLTQLFGG